MPEPTINDILVILARLESAVDSVNSKLDKLEEQTEKKFLTVEKQVGQHWQKLNDHEVSIQLLKERQGPRVHWSSWVAVIVGALGFIAAFVTWVVK
jgi:hypothetical protein